VKLAFVQLRLCDGQSGEQVQDELRTVLADVKALWEPRLLKQQRRGKTDAAAFNAYVAVSRLIKA
jgi:hypothetical protein